MGADFWRGRVLTSVLQPKNALLLAAPALLKRSQLNSRVRLATHLFWNPSVPEAGRKGSQFLRDGTPWDDRLIYRSILCSLRSQLFQPAAELERPQR
jgi:hypothetical protein